MTDANTLQRMIAEAFPVSPVPAVLFDAQDPNPSGYLPGDVVSSFGGKRWIDVSLMDWRNSPGAGAVRDYLSVEAFVYYLPSALKASLEDPEFFLIGVECLLPMNKKREPKGEKWAEFSRALTDAQRACVVEFLKIGVEGQFADPSVPYESDIALRLWSWAGGSGAVRRTAVRLVLPQLVLTNPVLRFLTGRVQSVDRHT